MLRPTVWRPGVVFRSRARRHIEVVRASSPVWHGDQRTYIPGVVVQFTDYVYRPRDEAEFNMLKAHWESQWGHTPDNGANVCLWGEMPDNPPEMENELVRMREEQATHVPVVHGALSSRTNAPVVKH